jgi:peptidoglycan-associated lipoprotein
MTLGLAGVLFALTVAVGCASRKQVSPPTSDTAPPPPVEVAPPQEETTQAPPPPQETRVELMDAFFDYDDASLRDDAKNALETNAKYLERNDGERIVIEGHCDERGSVEYNLALGEKRARAARDFLVSYGISTGRITTISYGKERPFDPGHGEEAWAKNRRAHFVAK